jgi:lysozyme
MKTSPRGIEDLVLSEGLRLKAYRDSVGVWTIGVGHAATSGAPPIPKAGMTITRQEALDILARDLVRYEKDVNAVLPNVPQHVFDGAVSFHFNTGAIKRASWVNSYKRGDMAAARAAFMTWRKPPEIIGRRTREADLIFKGKYHSKPVGEPVTPVDPSSPILRKGDGFSTNVTPAYANAIKVAQRLLNERGFISGWSPDGRFGSGTEAMVKAFQRQRNLVADGVIGPATWAELRRIGSGGIAPVPPPPDIPSPIPDPLEPDLPDDPERAERIKPVEWVIAIGVIGTLLIGAFLGFKFLT